MNPLRVTMAPREFRKCVKLILVMAGLAPAIHV